MIGRNRGVQSGVVLGIRNCDMDHTSGLIGLPKRTRKVRLDAKWFRNVNL